jgi:hypothetical protein
MHDRRSEEYDHRDQPQKRVSIHERLSFPQEQSARAGRVEESDESSYCREFISESESQGCPGGLTRSQKRSAAPKAKGAA